MQSRSSSCSFAGTASTFVGGDIGFVDQPASRTTREAVRKQLLDHHAALATDIQAP